MNINVVNNMLTVVN